MWTRPRSKVRYLVVTLSHSRAFSVSLALWNTEVEEKESVPAKRKRGAEADEPKADDSRADEPEDAPEPAEKRQRTRKPTKEIPEEPEEAMDFGEGGGEEGRPEEEEKKDEPPKEPEVESSDEDEPGKTPKSDLFIMSTPLRPNSV